VKRTGSNWRKATLVTIAVFALLCAAHTQLAAQAVTHSKRSSFDQLFPAAVNHNLGLEHVSSYFALTHAESLARPGESSAPDDDNKFPAPDFSAMAKWYEIRKWEYDIYDHTKGLKLLIVAKKESRPRYFDLRFEDADGVIVPNGEICICCTRTPYLVVNQPEKCSIWIPEKKVMKTVKKVYAVESD
jgi:hypothetical protein